MHINVFLVSQLEELGMRQINAILTPEISYENIIYQDLFKEHLNIIQYQLNNFVNCCIPILAFIIMPGQACVQFL